MGISLLEAIDNWKHMIKKNHVTEASQSLRDTADAILKMTQTLRGQFDDMKKMFDDLAKSQQEHEEKLSREKNTQDCTEKPEEEESDETFLREDTADRVLREASPSNFNFYYQTRAGRGGGTAIQFTQALQSQQIHFDFITTFEFVAAVLQHEEWDEPILFINVYHRPGYNLTQFRAFLDEFQTLLDEVLIINSIIVTGDFNIWVDVENRRATDEFDWLLLINNLDQHVQEPTHRAGHFLDLVITRNVEIFDLFVLENGISDHYTVNFNARPVSKDTREKTKESMEQDEQAKQFKKKEE
ncbi:hypothetical protein EPR50_G00165060 [Perca flavescens]|uniref:Endonuclease/exonuclease/phosphatase domain-containing protein n=1 Tax=Perca flavescens TaxID=8167 RepID=A0A484CJ30_PERFV|nr:hypothetical protein EPR50_G00165060 [Perca flavescens]